jgi:hypothetical protein
MKFRIAHSFVAVSLALGGVSALVAGPVHAQGTATTRAQVKMDRDTFLSMVRYDHATGYWVLKDDAVMPEGMPSRDEVKAMRDKFLSMHTWDPVNTKWVPVKGEPRDMSKLSRAQVKADTERFLKMMRFDERTATWMSRN